MAAVIRQYYTELRSMILFLLLFRIAGKNKILLTACSELPVTGYPSRMI